MILFSISIVCLRRAALYTHSVHHKIIQSLLFLCMVDSSIHPNTSCLEGEGGVVASKYTHRDLIDVGGSGGDGGLEATVLDGDRASGSA